jgi:Asp-tRNA(Asn)/Glu-tRNA(Gln) amidotransferase A subunit family amidase
MPTALHFTGQVLGDETILRLAQAFQVSTDHHLKRPPLRS